MNRSKGTRLELARYLAIIRRWWWTIVVATWAAGLAGYVAGTRIPATYESEATVLVGPVSADFETQRAAGQLVQTYAEIVRSRPIIEASIDQLGLPDAVGALRRQVTAIADSTTRFLTIRVQYESPETAAAIANALYENLDAETASGTIRPEGEPTLWEEASANPDQVAPEIGLIVALAAGAGLAGALFLVISIEYLVAPVRDPQEITDSTGAEVLGIVNTWAPRGGASRGGLLVNVAPDSPAAVAYRLLARRLVSLPGDLPRSLAVVAPTGNSASGEIAGNVAAALALGGRRVALVDANDEEQSLSRILQLWGHRGLDDVMDRGPAALRGLLDANGNLQVIPHGPRVSLPLIDATDCRAIIDMVLATGRVDVVLVDGGIATSGSNALLWAGAADATLLVAKRDQTRSSALGTMSELLSLAGAKVVGGVLHVRRVHNIHQSEGRRAQAPHGQSRDGRAQGARTDARMAQPAATRYGPPMRARYEDDSELTPMQPTGARAAPPHDAATSGSETSRAADSSGRPSQPPAWAEAGQAGTASPAPSAADAKPAAEKPRSEVRAPSARGSGE